jgi:D-aminopeptidase
VGVLVQCNYGARRDLRIGGVPVGEEIPDLVPCHAVSSTQPLAAGSVRRRCDEPAPGGDEPPEQGSIIVVVATDAPLLPHQLKRIATRVSLGIGRQGGFGGNGSGDIFIAFSTANPGTWSSESVSRLEMVTNDRLSPLFQATAQATEAAITNALLAAETMTGADDLRVYAMPLDRLLAAMRKYGRGR